ncbi:PDZ domain-containing protein [Streptomyces monticola]|uniref:PDZ domain-containing protein n=1 Tax=Streptomyces monticola TaxID=2666263 RepID=A0ABW2JA62_9ACTN
MEQTALRPKPMPGSTAPTTGAGHRPHAARRRGRRLMTALFSLLVAVVLVLAGVGLGTVGATVIGMSKLADLKQQAAAAQGGVAAQEGAAAGPGSGAADPKRPAQPSQQKPQGGKGREKGGADGTSGGAARTSGGAVGTSGGAARTSGGAVGTSGGAVGGAVRATLGVEAVDAPKADGALLVGVHSPGPGHLAGLVRGDVLLTFGKSRVRSAADLAAAVGDARPGAAVNLTVRHENGGRQILSVTPGVVT